MVKKGFRIRSLSPDMKVLISKGLARAQSAGMSEQDFYDYIEKNGKLPEINAPNRDFEFENKVGEINKALSQPYKREDVAKKFRGEVDEGSLSPDELQARLEAFQDQQPTKDFNITTLRDKLVERFGKAGADDLLPILEANLRAKGRFPDQQELYDAIPEQYRFRYFQLLPVFRDELGSGMYTTETKGNTEDVKRLQDLISSGELKSQRESQLDELNTSLRDEAMRGRESFIGGELDRGAEYFQNELDPQIRAQLNTRGLLDSGNLQSELARGASDILAPIQQKELAMQEEDDLFFANAAYNTTLRREIEAGRDITGQIEFERGRERSRNEYRFQKAQADLTAKFQEQSLKRQGEDALRIQKRQLDAQEDRARSDRTNQLIGGIAGTVGQIGGTYLGGKLAQKSVVKDGVTG